MSGEVHRDVQARLTTQRGKTGIWSLTLDDLGDVFGRDGLDIGRVGELRIGHDRRGIRIGEYDLVSLGPKDLASLHSGVIELACLTDHDRSGSDHKDLLDVLACGH